MGDCSNLASVLKESTVNVSTVSITFEDSDDEDTKTILLSLESRSDEPAVSKTNDDEVLFEEKHNDVSTENSTVSVQNNVSLSKEPEDDNELEGRDVAMGGWDDASNASSTSSCALVLDTDVNSDEIQESQSTSYEHQAKSGLKELSPKHNRSNSDTKKANTSQEQLQIGNIEKKRHFTIKEDKDTADSETDKIKSSKLKRLGSSRDLLECDERQMGDQQKSQKSYSAKKSGRLCHRSLRRPQYRGFQKKSIGIQKGSKHPKQCSGDQSKQSCDHTECGDCRKERSVAGTDSSDTQNKISGGPNETFACQKSKLEQGNSEQGQRESRDSFPDSGKRPAGPGFCACKHPRPSPRRSVNKELDPAPKEQVPKETDQQRWEREKNIAYTMFGVRKRPLQASEQTNTHARGQTVAEETSPIRHLVPEILQGERRSIILQSNQTSKTRPLEYNLLDGIRKPVNKVNPHKQPSQNQLPSNNISNQPTQIINEQSTNADFKINNQSANGDCDKFTQKMQQSLHQPKGILSNDVQHVKILNQVRSNLASLSNVVDLKNITMTMEVNLDQLDKAYKILNEIENYVKNFNKSATHRDHSIFSQNLDLISEHDYTKGATVSAVKSDSDQACFGISDSLATGFNLFHHSETGSAKKYSDKVFSISNQTVSSQTDSQVASQSTQTDDHPSYLLQKNLHITQIDLTKDSDNETNVDAASLREQAPWNRNSPAKSQTTRATQVYPLKTRPKCTQTGAAPGCLTLTLESASRWSRLARSHVPQWATSLLASVEAERHRARHIASLTELREKVPVLLLTETPMKFPVVISGLCKWIDMVPIMRGPNVKLVTMAGTAHKDPVKNISEDIATSSTQAAANNAVLQNVATQPTRVLVVNPDQSLIPVHKNQNDFQPMIINGNTIPNMMDQTNGMPLYISPNNNPLQLGLPNLPNLVYLQSNTVKNYNDYFCITNSNITNNSTANYNMTTQAVNNNFSLTPNVNIGTASLGQLSHKTADDAGVNQNNAILQNIIETGSMLQNANQSGSLLKNTNQSGLLLTNTNQSGSLLTNTNQSGPLLTNTNQSGFVLNTTQIGSVVRIATEARLLQRNVPQTDSVMGNTTDTGSVIEGQTNKNENRLMISLTQNRPTVTLPKSTTQIGSNLIRGVPGPWRETQRHTDASATSTHTTHPQGNSNTKEIVYINDHDFL